MARSGRCYHTHNKDALILLALAAATVVACADRPTEPSPALALTSSAAVQNASPRPSGAPATLEWQKTARGLVKDRKFSPINAIRAYALHSVAQYAAVVAVGRGDDGALENAGRADYEAQRGAIAGASAQMLSYLFPDDTAAIRLQLETDANAGPGNIHPHFTRGVAVGRAAGDAMIAWAKADGFSLAWNESMRNASGVGIWEGAKAVPPATVRPAPAGYQFPTMTPYFLKAMNGNTAQSQFRSAPPPAYSLLPGRYQTDLAEVKDISVHRTQAQIDIANFWNLAAGTQTALGYWDEQAALYIGESNFDEAAASHFYALMNAAVMDATIGCWEAKYHYLMLRPTMADPTITTVYALPNHPSYPSGHSCVSSASAAILSYYFPVHTDKLQADVVEAGMSRIYGGIHYRFDIEAGQTLGRATAAWALAYDQQYGLLTAVGLGAQQVAERR